MLQIQTSQFHYADASIGYPNLDMNTPFQIKQTPISIQISLFLNSDILVMLISNLHIYLISRYLYFKCRYLLFKFRYHDSKCRYLYGFYMFQWLWSFTNTICRWIYGIINSIKPNLWCHTSYLWCQQLILVLWPNDIANLKKSAINMSWMNLWIW